MKAVRIPVLMYHRVGNAQNPWERRYCVDPEVFANHLAKLKKHGYQAISVDDFLAWLEGAITVDEGAFVITFDDGYRGVYEHAFPTLVQFGWSATVFLVSDLIGKQDEWTRSSNPSGTTHSLMGLKEIREMMDAGFTFHSHSRHHPSLPTLDDSELEDEITGSRTSLEGLLEQTIDLFAYPYGHLNQQVCAAVERAGYRAAFSTQPGFNRRDVDKLRIRRLDIFGTDSPHMLLRKLRYGSNDGSWQQVARYYLQRLSARLRGNR